MNKKQIIAIILLLTFCCETVNVYACGGHGGSGTVITNPEPPDGHPTGENTPNQRGNGPGTSNDKDKNKAKGQDPIFLASGKYGFPVEDLRIPGKAMDLVIKRTYLSGTDSNGSLDYDGHFSHDSDPCIPIIGYHWDIAGAYDIKGQGTPYVNCKYVVPGHYPVYLTVFDPGYYEPYWVSGAGQACCGPGNCAWCNGYCWVLLECWRWVDEPEPSFSGISFYVRPARHHGRFGYGWDMNYDIRVIDPCDPQDSDARVLDDGEGHWLWYEKVGNAYKRPDGVYDDLIKNTDPNNPWTVLKKDGTKWEFNGDGSIWKIIDRNGNAITFGYETDNEYAPGLVDKAYKRLVTITDDLGRKINLSYDMTGLLSTMTDFDNRRWIYRYDYSTCNLLSVTGPTGLVTTYTYDGNHNMLTATDANDTVYLTNIYDANQVTEQTYGYGTSKIKYDPGNHRAVVTDRRDVNSVTVYNATENPLSVKIYTKGWRTTHADPCSYTTTYAWNKDLEKLLEVFPDGNCISYTYDPNGNMTGMYRKSATTEPNDPNDSDVIGTTFEYKTKYNHVTKMRDPMGNITEYTYDDNGNLTKIKYPTVSTPNGNERPEVNISYSDGRIDTVTDPCGIVTTYEYYTTTGDPNYGHLKDVIVDSATGGLNLTTKYYYDTLGRVIAVKDPNYDVTKYTYDANDQLTKVTAPSPYSYVTDYLYNKNKKLRQVEKELTGGDQIFKYGYDKLDHIATVTDPCSYVTKTGYDKSENLSDVNDAEKNKTQYQYDERDLLWKVTDANGGVTEYFYTKNSKVSIIRDARGFETSYTYDKFDRLKRITYWDGTYEEFTYDKSSNVTKKRTRKGDEIKYWYDAMNRLTAKKAGGDPNIYYHYDIAGRIHDVVDGRSSSDGGGTTSYIYDHAGRVKKIINPDGRAVQYEYNNKGLRSKITYPDTSWFNYSYDKLGRLVKITQGQNETLIATYSYDALSRKASVSYGNSVGGITYQYDIANHVKGVTNSFTGSNSVVFGYPYYDKVGNRLCMDINSSEYCYEYDKLYQLTHADYPGGEIAVGYDKLGNRTSTVDNSGTVEYDQSLSNGLNQYDWVLDNDHNIFSYDDNGNMTLHGLNYLNYEYDCENHLTRVDRNWGTLVDISYKYDYLGRRVKKINGSTTTTYVYDGDRIILEYDGSNWGRRYVYGAGIDERVCIFTSVITKYFYHYDALGSVIALSDHSGSAVEKYSYDAFGTPTIRNVGNQIISASAYENTYMFTGRSWDSQTKLYYYRARDYTPDIGRFLQPDPIMPYIQIAAAGLATGDKVPGKYLSGVALQNYLQTDSIGKFLVSDPAGRFLVTQTFGIPTEINLYTYCGNNPVMYIDPYGNFGPIGWGGAILVAGGVGIKSPALIGIGGAMMIYDVVHSLETVPDKAVKPLENPRDNLNQAAKDNADVNNLYPNRKGCPSK